MVSVSIADRDQELIELVERDYAHTGEFIRSVVGTSATVRGWAVTIWLALIGFAFDRPLGELAILAAIVVVAFAIIDAYHARLYVQALAHAARLERVVAAYYSALTLAEDDPDALDDFHDELDAFRPGLYGSFRRLGVSEGPVRRDLLARLGRPLRDTATLVRDARPRVFFSVLYPILFAVACVAWIVIVTTT